MKAAIYCRLSEEDKNKRSENEDSGSIQNQKSMLIQYALERQWEIYAGEIVQWIAFPRVGQSVRFWGKHGG